MGKKEHTDTIGLVLAYKGANYGALLQAYATQQIIESMGFRTLIFDYIADGSHRHIKFDMGLIPYLFLQVVQRCKQKDNHLIVDNLHQQNIDLRKNVSDAFRKKMLHDIGSCLGYNQLISKAKKCRAVLIGSDQMWLPGVSFGNHLSLRFVPQGIRRISYATSLGVSSYPWYCRHSARSMWKAIDYLSVREIQGKTIVEKICPNKDVKVVVDPTYLLTQKQWEERIPVQKMRDEKYLLCYFLGNSDSQKLSAVSFARHMGLKCITLLSNESMSSIDISFADEVVIGASPEEFVNWIRGAEYIFTDSFHGVAFSVINKKQFYVFYRRRDDVKQSRNSRIDNILRLWGLEHRLLSSADLTGIVKQEDIDYSVVQPIIDQEREDSLRFLNKASEFND